jgi:hypothetical protein
MQVRGLMVGFVFPRKIRELRFYAQKGAKPCKIAAVRHIDLDKVFWLLQKRYLNFFFL